MSSKQSKPSAAEGGSPARRDGGMSSITRRLYGPWLMEKCFSILFQSIFFLALGCTGYLAYLECTNLGGIILKAARSLTASARGEGVKSLIYRVVLPDASASFEAPVYEQLRLILLACGALLLFRLLFLLLVSAPSQNRRIRRVLEPLNELALKADELSRLDFGEDKYQLLEDAISHLDADASARLTLSDSDLRGIETAINNLLTRVRESSRQQARFVNDASHELRTPLAVISGYADMLARWGKDDEKVLDEAIGAIRTETSRMQHLVEQLLFLARGDSGRTQLQPEPTDLDALMREIYEESLMIDEKHIYRFTPSGEELVVSADPGLLKQAVRILTDNAAKYTREGDEILLRTGRQDGRPFLQVQDSGIGMAEADVAHMFERFYRADKARSFEGTGLGLSIAKWIVDKHRGHFEILSRTDIGTRIRIVLEPEVYTQ